MVYIITLHFGVWRWGECAFLASQGEMCHRPFWFCLSFPQFLHFFISLSQHAKQLPCLTFIVLHAFCHIDVAKKGFLRLCECSHHWPTEDSSCQSSRHRFSVRVESTSLLWTVTGPSLKQEALSCNPASTKLLWTLCGFETRGTVSH